MTGIAVAGGDLPGAIGGLMVPVMATKASSPLFVSDIVFRLVKGRLNLLRSIIISPDVELAERLEAAVTLTGEVSVAINPKNFPSARNYNGMLAIGDLNFSSVQARSSRAKLLEERSNRSLDWYGRMA